MELIGAVSVSGKPRGVEDDSGTAGSSESGIMTKCVLFYEAHMCLDKGASRIATKQRQLKVCHEITDI